MKTLTYQYDPETGEIRREGISRPMGKNKDGYLKTSYRGKSVYNHRLAWFLFYGSWPEQPIDHINGVRNDNRIQNLRLASNAENKWNVGKSSQNTSGFRGASFHKKLGKWQSKIRHDGKLIWLGVYDSAEDAGKAYASAAIKLRGEFARID